MSIDCYYGAYARFDTISKRDAAVLIGSDCIVGDTFDIQFRPYKLYTPFSPALPSPTSPNRGCIGERLPFFATIARMKATSTRS